MRETARSILSLLDRAETRDRLEQCLVQVGSTDPGRSADTLTALAGVQGFPASGEAIVHSLLTAGNIDAAIRSFHEAVESWNRSLQKPLSLDNPAWPVVVRLFGNSDFLTRRVIHRPKRLSETLDSPFLFKERPAADFREEILTKTEEISEAGEWAALYSALREVKYREFLRITARDLGGLGDFTEITREISSLAAACLEAACRWALRSLVGKHGRVRIRYGDRKPVDVRLAVLGMGKLGGSELNYSSDIDIIFLYGSDETVRKPALTPHEFCCRAVEMVTHALSERTDDGFVFRVDLRLRPEGRSGALANSLEAAERYYETWGTLFERQAMLKARAVAGDIPLGEDFLRAISAFRYPQSVDERILDSVREMKDRIDRGPGAERDIKKCRGGIREIEFFLQALQLLTAGQRPALRSLNTLEGIGAFRDEGLIDPETADTLEQAYRFLRTLEHRIQLVEERQTHTLPRRPEEEAALARRMGYAEGDREEARAQMLHDLERTRQAVRAIFEGLFRGS